MCAADLSRKPKYRGKFAYCVCVRENHFDAFLQKLLPSLGDSYFMIKKRTLRFELLNIFFCHAAHK